MASSRQSLIPNYLYSSSFSSPSNSFLTNNENNNNNKSMMTSAVKNENKFVIQAPSEPLGKIEMYSPQFYAACTAGGILSCGLTHMTVTPLDLVKCNMQVSDSLFGSGEFYVILASLLCSCVVDVNRV
ncbi:mitochondrial phosphate carrier protein 3, mitochondrial-like protein, partial [Tanacetum coccineum]